MQRVHQVSGIMLLLFAIVVGYFSTQLTYFTSLGPGPGFFPFWLAVILSMLSLVMVAQATLRQNEPRPSDFLSTASGYLKSVSAVAALVVVAIFIDRVGFVLTMFIFYLALLSIFGQRHILLTAVLTFAGSFGIYYLFAHLLSTPLPRGLYSF